MMEMENEFPAFREKMNSAALKVQSDAGMQPLKLSDAEAAKWIKTAVDAGWEDLMKKDPVNTPKIRELTTKK